MALVAGMSLAVYTTVYPGVESYLPDWYSLPTPTDGSRLRALDWLRHDRKGIGSEDTRMATVAAHWVECTSGQTPAQIRQEVLAQIVETCAGVVLVDSDDVLHPTRVAAARAGLEVSELVACALCLVDQQGKDLGLTFNLPANV